MPEATAARSPIALLRFVQGLSQSALAARANVARETISRIERGENPRLDTARVIAAALGVPLAQIFPEDIESAPATDGTLSAASSGGAAGHALVER